MGPEPSAADSEARAHLTAIIQGLDDAFIATDRDGNVTSWGRGAEALYGYDAEEMVGAHISRIYTEDDRFIADIIAPIERGERLGPVERVRRRKDGSLVEVEVYITPIFDEEGRVVGTSGYAHDITRRRAREQEIQESRVFLERTQELAHIGSWRAITDEEAVLLWTPEMYRICGVDPATPMRYRDLMALVLPDDRELVEETAQRVLRTGVSEELEFRIVRPDGRTRWLSGATDALVDEKGQPIGWTGVCRDITEQKENEARLQHEALYDPLTGLPNEALLHDRISRALERASEIDSKVALLLVDLDRFKILNDDAGRDHGDAVLQAVARRLRDGAALTDTVGRLESDEIVVVCEGIRDGFDALARAELTIGSFERPFVIADRSNHVTASIGVAVSGPHSTVESLLRDADLAMVRAKERGRNRFELYDLELRQRSDQRAELEAGLWAAIERGQLYLEFQPIASLEEDRFLGAEALIRWHHPDRGRVGPEEFIPLAEAVGAIVPIGTWALQAAAQQLQRWRSEYAEARRWSLSVNVSATQLSAPDFVGTVANIFLREGVDPSAIALELTESIFLDPVLANEVLPKLRELGLRISIDDFGTGFSSLAYLKNVVVDEMKIDKTFIDDLIAPNPSTAIVAAIISIAHSLGLQVTAEGVTSEVELEVLQRLGCHAAQGFLFAPPLDPDDCLAMLLGTPRTQPQAATGR